jgi:serine protease Do
VAGQIAHAQHEVRNVKTHSIVLNALLLSSALACGWAGGVYSNAKKAKADPPAKMTATAPEAREVGAAFVEVADRLAPSVVRITVQEQAPRASHGPGRELNPFEGTPFEHFFKNFGGEEPENPRPVTGMGSGVAIDDQGHILTNNHVVADADEVRVTFVDGKELKGKVVGTDPKTDLAVLKVDAKTKPADFGDAEHMRVGEWVIAIGNPFGLDHSVTVGVLSAKGRYGFAPGKLEDFLQTDASINPGNSGGPLVNLNGQIVGINTMIAGLGTGVGFAVSEAIAKPIARQLIEHGKVTRPYLGIVMQSLTPELRKALGANAPEKGALVSQVQPGSPAEKAGIHLGDVVVRIAGKPTEDSRSVQRVVLDQNVGDTVTVSVWREGKELDLRVKTAELPADSAPRKAAGGSAEGKLGLSLQTLTPELADRFGLDHATKGALVTGARPGSSAAEAGLRAGDVIVEIDRAPVTSAEDAAKRFANDRNGGHLVRVQRGDTAIFLAIAPPRENE